MLTATRRADQVARSGLAPRQLDNGLPNFDASAVSVYVRPSEAAQLAASQPTVGGELV